MAGARHVLIMKAAVGLTWLVGLADVIFRFTPIPRAWWFLLAALSLLIHACQCLYFMRRQAPGAAPAAADLLQILIFGAPHILALKQRRAASAP